jgi:hypothetical protein
LAVRTLIELGALHLDHLREKNLDLTELRDIEIQLHDIDFARFFACFDNTLRNYWKFGLKKKTVPSTESLISSISARRQIPQDLVDIVQEIRDFRNSVVHDEHEVKRRIGIDEASRQLNTFLSRLPLQWGVAS